MARRQLEITGAERPSVPALDKVIDAYTSILYARMEMQRKELDAKNSVDAAMLKHKREIYVRYDGEWKFTVRRKPGKDQITCKREELKGDE